MNQGDGFLAKPRRVRFAICLFGVLLVAFLFLPYNLAPHQFLPSAAYVESVKYFALLTAAVCAVLGITLAIYLPFNLWRRVTGLGYLLNIVLVPIAFAVFGHMFVTTTIPLYVALLWGEETSMTFAVESLEHEERKSCKTSARLAGIPTLAYELCDLPPDAQQQLTPGTEIIMIGRGTHMGLFVESARLAEPMATP